MAASDNNQATIEEVKNQMEEMSLISFRKPEEIKKLAIHFQHIINDPKTQEQPTIVNYLRKLDDIHHKIYTTKKEGTTVEYIFCADTKNSQQRQRFNSVSVTEISEILKTEFPSSENAKQAHICIDCEIEIEIDEEKPLQESLQRHFDLEVHQPRKKIAWSDVAEPLVLPNMSRRKSAMERGESLPASTLESLEQIAKNTEKLDRMFSAKLEASLIRNLPDNSEASIDAAVKFYQGVFHNLCQDLAQVDLSTLTNSVAPIIMSIKDNVNQNFALDANKNFENEDNDNLDKAVKNQTRVTRRYYGFIETGVRKLLSDHKLLSLPDDRTAKPAFFCMACEFYTLRFRYDSVLNHVFSETHIHNLSTILNTDTTLPFGAERSIDYIKSVNQKYLFTHSVTLDGTKFLCKLCDLTYDTLDMTVLHVLEENHLARLSDKFYRKMKVNPDTVIPEEWGNKSFDWSKYLTTSGKIVTTRDYVITENFIKPKGKIANYCVCCDLLLKGPRQVLFNHIRQKKHLRNAAPHKLSLLFKNQCRAVEYYASFGNFYMCSLCPESKPVPSFASIVEHFESDKHIETIAKLISLALHGEPKTEMLKKYCVAIEDDIFRCTLCEVNLQSQGDAISHILSNIKHQTALVEKIHAETKGDIISVYMKGNYILYNEAYVFNCVVCKGVFGSLRALLMHLIYTEHFQEKPYTEDVFRFYLELKHNINLSTRNKFVYTEFGRLFCNACKVSVEGTENAKRHVGSLRHKESLGASYTNAALDVNQDAGAANYD